MILFLETLILSWKEPFSKPDLATLGVIGDHSPSPTPELETAAEEPQDVSKWCVDHVIQTQHCAGAYASHFEFWGFFYDISCISFGISLALFLYGHGWVVIKTTFSIFGISSNFKFNVNALLEFVHYDIRLSINMFNICLLLITRASAAKFL